MGRPPCCDKIGVKKGPWTPEEDIVLVSYIQEHGPGNWRAVPTNTGLLRCSKSCRLRWTNYLRPGIKRGNFTEQEEKLIIHLQDLLGNRWAAIASYLPQRTDNDIKNFWNTHLQKKLKKIQGGHGSSGDGDHEDIESPSNSHKTRKGKWERRLQTDIHTAKQALCDALSLKKPVENDQDYKPLIINQHVFNTPDFPQASGVYASSAENIARLLQNWKNTPPKISSKQGGGSGGAGSDSTDQSSCSNNPSVNIAHSRSPSGDQGTKTEVLESLMCFSSTNSNTSRLFLDQDQDQTQMVPLTFLEKWLLDDGAATAAAAGAGAANNNHGINGDLMDIPLGGTADLF